MHIISNYLIIFVSFSGRVCCFGLNFLSDSNVNKKNLLEHFEKAQKHFLSCVMNLQTEYTESNPNEVARNKLQVYHNLSRQVPYTV